MFDITFLMLCHIAQQYGADVSVWNCEEKNCFIICRNITVNEQSCFPVQVVTSNGETKDSFFEQWVSECLSEGGKCKSPDMMLQRADGAKIDMLLQQFSTGDGDLKTKYN